MGIILSFEIDNSNFAGPLLFIGACNGSLFVMAAETLFHGYSTRVNDLSDLASTVPPNVTLIQPSGLWTEPF